MIYSSKKRIFLAAMSLCLLLLLSFVLLLQPAAVDPALEDTYYTFNVTVNDESMGSVAVSGGSQNDGGQFLYGHEVTMTATPKPGYKVKEWIGDSKGGEVDVLKITPSKATGTVYSYTVVFEPKQFSITIDSEPAPEYEPDTVIPKFHTYGTATKLPIPKSSVSHTFKGWIVNSGSGVKDKLYAPGASLGAEDFTEDIRLTASFEPNAFNVTCYDRVWGNETHLLGTVPISSYFGAENVSGADAAVAVYRGYHFLNQELYRPALPEVTANNQTNVVTRYYLPKTYRIIYQDCDIPAGAPTTHTYGTATQILNPVREGYTFVGWELVNWDSAGHGYDAALISRLVDCSNNNLSINGEAFDHTGWTYEGRDSEDYAIVLKARWSVNHYTVLYEDIYNNSAKLENDRVYDTDFVLPDDLTREGYTFIGWRLSTDADTVPFQKGYKIPASSNSTDRLTFVAGWKANDYTVTLDPDATVGITPGTTTTTATFDAAMPSITPPRRDGYTFLGFYSGKDGSGTQYYTADGKGIDGRVWNVAADTTLYAKWQINDCEISFTDDFYALCDSIEINGKTYNGVPLVFEYGTVLTVRIATKTGYKVVAWQGAAVAHTADFEGSHTVEGHITLQGVILEVEPTPSFRLDYRLESLTVPGGIPAGNYLLICGSDEIRFTVAENGQITMAADQSVTDRVPASAYFGKTIKLIRLGDGTAKADSLPQSIVAAKRPAAPKPNVEIKFVSFLDRYVQIQMGQTGSVIYEFAVSLTKSPDGNAGLSWSSSLRFDDLKPGTPYYVYIRVAATDVAPHGEAYETTGFTLSANYLQEQKNLLMDKKQEGDGANVDRVIADAIAKMEAVGPGSDYEEQITDIREAAEAALPFARLQDHCITALNKAYNDLASTGAYSEAVGIPALQQVLSKGLDAVQAATTESELQRIANEAKLEYAAVLISYLYFGEEFMLTCNGIDRDFRLAASRVGDLSTVAAQIRRAVQAGTIVVGGTQMTLLDAMEALRSLDVVGSYNLQLSHKNLASVAKPNGPFEIRLLIPTELRGESGLLVAYYRYDTEELKVLDTRRDGNYLIFTADSVESFVILADHTVQLTNVILALAVTLLCQLVALILILVRRAKYAKQCRSNVLALPLVALTVRFLPANSVNIVLLLAALVVLLQILLMWLLMSSDVIHRKKKKPADETPEALLAPAPEAAPDGAPAEPTETPETDPYLTVLAPQVEDGYEETELTEDEEGFDPDAPVYEPDVTAEEAADAEELAEAEDWYGDNGFIEPAANPRYSLPEDAYADDAYAEDDGYATDDAYAEDGGYATDDVYAEDDGYATDDAYAEDDGYAADDAYAEDDGYATDDAYAEDDGYATDDAYAEDGGYAADDAYAEDGGYAADEAYAEDGGYAADDAYAEDDGYADDNAYVEDDGYAFEPDAEEGEDERS